MKDEIADDSSGGPSFCLSRSFAKPASPRRRTDGLELCRMQCDKAKSLENERPAKNLMKRIIYKKVRSDKAAVLPHCSVLLDGPLQATSSLGCCS